jgi:hypothetical protein
VRNDQPRFVEIERTLRGLLRHAVYSGIVRVTR